MHTQGNQPQYINTVSNLSYLDKDQLNELLVHRNKLMSVAAITGIKDTDYITSLQKEIEMITAELESRKA